MSDTTKSIKGASNQELGIMIRRVRQEYEALRMLREVYLKSIPNPNGPYPAYATEIPFSTETPVNDGKSIKQMTDKELIEFVIRLQNENELTRIISNIKEMNSPQITSEGHYPDGKMYDGIDLNTPVKDLYHFGIPGMKWGRRSARSSGGTPSSQKTKASEDYDTVQTLRKKGRRNLSTAELKKVTERLNLEKSYKQLNPSKYEKGLAIVKGITAAGTTIAGLYKMSQDPMIKDIITKLRKKAG